MTANYHTPNDLDMLSAYLDGRLSAEDRAVVERRLAAEPSLQAELDALSATVALLRRTPQLAVPRSFTLDPARYRRVTPWWARYGAMQTLGALGTAAAIVLIAFGLLNAPPTVETPAAAGVVASQSTPIADAVTAPATVDTPTPLEAALDPRTPVLVTLGTLPPAATVVIRRDSPQPLATGILMQATAAPVMPTALAPPGAFATTATADGVTQYTADSGHMTETAQAAGLAAPAAASASESGTENAAAAESQPGVGGGMMPVTPTPLPTASAAKALATTPTLAESEDKATTPAATGTPLSVANAQEATTEAAPTSAPAQRARQESVSSPPLALIIGIALLVLSLMLAGIGFMRSRLR